MGFAAPLPWTKKSYSLAAYAGKTIYIAFREYVASNGVNGAVVGIDLVKAGSISGLDVSLTEINVPKFVKKGESKTFSGKIINNGGDNITSYDVTYECEGNTSAVYSVTGINIATTQMHEFTHDAPYTFNNEGVHDVTIKISNVNGGGETNLDNNQKTSQVSVYDNSVERNVLLENFTTGQCPNCPPVHQLLENYIETQPKAILIAQHAGFYTDDMTIPENTELLVLYNSSGSYAPALSVDRFHFPTGLGGGSPDPGPVFFPNGAAATQRIEDRLNVPAFVSVDINKVASSKGDITFKVSGEFVSGVAGSDLRLGVYIIEDSLIYPQSGGNANYVHNNVMRDAISETWGDAGIITSTTAGSTFEKTYTYTLNDSWKEDKLSIVAFVANYDASDVNKRDILNAKEVKLTELEVAANEDIAGSDINIYPNPATDYVTISNVENSQIDIFDITGKLVKSLNADNQNITVNVNDLGAGTYILRVRNATNVVTKKLTIK